MVGFKMALYGVLVVGGIVAKGTRVAAIFIRENVFVEQSVKVLFSMFNPCNKGALKCVK